MIHAEVDELQKYAVLGPQFHFTYYSLFFAFLDFSCRSFIGGPTSEFFENCYTVVCH